MAVLEARASGAEVATLASVVATYQRVFDTILALVDFPDLDQPFNVNKGDDYDLWKP